MTHTQTVFLGHYVPMAVGFWLYCWYYSMKSKRVNKNVCRRANVNRL